MRDNSKDKRLIIIVSEITSKCIEYIEAKVSISAGTSEEKYRRDKKDRQVNSNPEDE